MKRVIAAIAVTCIALASHGAGAASVQTISNRSFDVSDSFPTGGFLHVSASSTTTTTVGGSQTTTTQICFELFDSSYNFDSGCGPAASFSLDPLLLDGSALGIISGRFGPVGISASYTVTHVNSNTPYADTETLTSPTPSSNTWVNFGRQGRGSATATRATQTFSLSNAPAWSASNTYVNASA